MKRFTMPLNRRLCPIYAAFVLLCNPLVAHSASDKIHYPSTNRATPQTAAEKQADAQRRSDIVQKSQYLFTLTGAEMAAFQGKTLLALNTYIDIFNQTRSPQVAERAMELAIANQSHTAAEQLFHQWQKEQPESSPALRRMSLYRAVQFGDDAHVNANLATVLAESNEPQIRALYLQLAKAHLARPQLAAATVDTVSKTSSQYPDLIEAQITAMLFQAAANHDKQAIESLQNIAKIDSELGETTRLALTLIVRDNPHILTQFFQRTDTTKLSENWQLLEVEHFNQHKQYDKAIAALQRMAKQFPTKDFALQAAILAKEEKHDKKQVHKLYEQAYDQAISVEQKSRVAVYYALVLMGEKQDEKLINQWLNRIQAASYHVDKQILHMAMLSEKQQWQAVLDTSKQLKTKSGAILNENAYYDFYLPAVQKSNLTNAQKLAAYAQAIKRSQQFTNKNQSDALYNLGLYYRGIFYIDELNQIDKGLADLRQYWQRSPEDSNALNAYGYSLLEYGKKSQQEQAFELIKKAYQKDPESSAINDSIGWAYFKKGDPQTALPYLQFAHKNHDDGEVAAHLGEVYWALGDKNKARQIWQESWKKDPKHKILLRTLKKYNITLK